MSDFQANGFTSSLLENWEDRSTITLVGQTSDDGFASNLVVTRQRVESGTSSSDFATSQIKELASQVQQLKVESQRQFTNKNNHEIFQQIHRFNVETRTIKQVQAYLMDSSVNHSTVFVITGTATPSTFKDALPQFQHFIESFRAVGND